jgi:hypothetical protein
MCQDGAGWIYAYIKDFSEAKMFWSAGVGLAAY